MRRLRFALSCFTVAVGLAAAADAAEPETRPRLRLDAVRGFRTAFDPESTESEDEPRETQGHSFVAGLSVPVADRWTASVRAPVTTATFLYSADEEVRVTSLGNVELAAALRLPLGRAESEIELGLALPTATGDEYGDDPRSVRRAHANLAASRFRGYLDNALFAAHRFGVAPSWRLTHAADRFRLQGFAKLELLFASGLTHPPPDLAEVNGTAAELVTGGDFELTPARDAVFRFALRSWVALTLVGEVKQPDRPPESVRSRVQLVVDPEIRMVAGALHTSVGLIVPVGGILGRTGYLAAQLGFGVEL